MVLEGLDAWARAAVASRGRAERMMEDERFSGIVEGDSSGMLSVIAVSCR